MGVSESLLGLFTGPGVWTFRIGLPWEPVIFHFPSRAAVRCGLGPRLSEMNPR